MSATRASLLIRVQEGADVDSWQEFHAAYEPLLARYALAYGVAPADVPDVVQEIFVKLLRILRRFRYDPRRARFRTWLRHIARHRILDWLRKSSRRRERHCDPQVLEAVHSTRSEFDWDREHRARIVAHALHVVRTESRRLTWRCFELHYLHGWTAPDVAHLTGLTVNGVYINAARTLKRVRRKCFQFDEELHHARPRVPR